MSPISSMAILVAAILAFDQSASALPSLEPGHGPIVDMTTSDTTALLSERIFIPGHAWAKFCDDDACSVNCGSCTSPLPTWSPGHFPPLLSPF